MVRFDVNVVTKDVADLEKVAVLVVLFQKIILEKVRCKDDVGKMPGVAVSGTI